jgi:DNA-directed RNA polymerase specialized sigma24 family protein
MSATALLPATEDLSFSKEVCIDESLSFEAFDVNKMLTWQETQPPKAETCAAMSETTWSTLYPNLRSLASYLVRTSPLPYWRGQEEDLAEDIVQETVRRVIERAQKAERGEASPIQSLKQMTTTVAYNYYRDLKRHDYRLSRMDTTDASMYSPHSHPADGCSSEDLLDAVADKVDQEKLFDQLAEEIGRFPPKQKRALLTDLANRMCFDGELTSLQKSFLRVGIELRHYRRELPNDHKERCRHISLVSQAYKRIGHLYTHPRV